MTPDQLDAMAAWAGAVLHRLDPERYPLTGDQVQARLATLPFDPAIILDDHPVFHATAGDPA